MARWSSTRPSTAKTPASSGTTTSTADQGVDEQGRQPRPGVDDHEIVPALDGARADRNRVSLPSSCASATFTPPRSASAGNRSRPWSASGGSPRRPRRGGSGPRRASAVGPLPSPDRPRGVGRGSVSIRTRRPRRAARPPGRGGDVLPEPPFTPPRSVAWASPFPLSRSAEERRDLSGTIARRHGPRPFRLPEAKTLCILTTPKSSPLDVLQPGRLDRQVVPRQNFENLRRPDGPPSETPDCWTSKP